MRSVVLFAVSAWFLSAAGPARAEIVYFEGFGSGTNTSLTSQGWQGWNTASAVNISNRTDEPIYVFTGTDWDGRYFIVRGGSTPALIATDEAGPIPVEHLRSVSFMSNHDNTSSAVRVAAEIGGNWYVTVQTFSMSANGDAYNWQGKAELDLFTWTNDASAWQALNFTPGTTLGLGGVLASDLTGEVTRLGLYFTGGPLRVDDFTVMAVPEPGTCLLAVGAWLLVLCVSRRRFGRR
ncbi:MAG: hypothetical protein U1E05_20620 [Patescibacteria group bacterium]|nr:hypothetical protein [Patescibacteria group bacterium]